MICLDIIVCYISYWITGIRFDMFAWAFLIELFFLAVFIIPQPVYRWKKIALFRKNAIIPLLCFAAKY